MVFVKVIPTFIDDRAQSVGAEEYTDCISSEGYDSPNKYPGYDTKQSDGEAPVMLES